MPRPDAPHPVLAAFDRLTRKPMGMRASRQDPKDVALVRAALEDAGPVTAASADRARVQQIRERLEKATPIPGTDGFMVDRSGAVYSTATNWRGYGARALAAHPNEDGYLKVRLVCGGRRKGALVHVLVATAFLGPKPSPEHEVRHLDGDKLNNTADNLAWGTGIENAADREAHGRTAKGERNGFARLNEDRVREIRRLLATGQTQRAVGHTVGVTQRAISNVATGKSWSHVV